MSNTEVLARENAMQITSAMVKELREKTGAGIMDCKEALAAVNGAVEEAVDYLRKKGLQAAAKRSTKTTREGVVGSYIHGGGRLGVLVEVNCETDFVARTDEFQELVHDIAMQVAASNPLYVSRQDVPPEMLERERSILEEQARAAGRPQHILAKIVECLLEQPFVKDPDSTVGDRIKSKIAKTGENITVSRFARFALGETS
jgi:elongation factor Ts